MENSDMQQKFEARVKDMARKLVQKPPDPNHPGLVEAKHFVMFADAVEALTEAYAEGMREGQQQMRERAATYCETGNRPHIGCFARNAQGDQYVPNAGTCHIAMAHGIRALPLSTEAEKGKA